MKDELIRKIQDVLDRRITNEKQVVYLLVEIRKLMDRDKYNDPVLSSTGISLTFMSTGRSLLTLNTSH
jgi:hypothetical protein